MENLKTNEIEINKVYIAGPISGIEGENKQAFKSAEQRLVKQQYIAVNPHKLDHSDNPTGCWNKYMKVCLSAMLECDGILMLNGWENSEGAQLELSTAVQVGIPYVFLGDCINTEISFQYANLQTKF